MKNTKTEMNGTELDNEELAEVRGGLIPWDGLKILKLLRDLKLYPIRLPNPPPPY
jgi:hypothetical protein